MRTVAASLLRVVAYLVVLAASVVCVMVLAFLIAVFLFGGGLQA